VRRYGRKERRGDRRVETSDENKEGRRGRVRERVGRGGDWFGPCVTFRAKVDEECGR
jgi:hypothetical protein